MSEFDDDQADINDAVSSFDSDTVDVDALMARLDRLQKFLAKREWIYSAAVQAYNSALRAVYDQFYLTANDYQRASDTVSRICSEITFEMHRRDEEKEEESPEWGRSEEGRKLARWFEVWQDFDESMTQEYIASVPGVKPRKTPLSEMIAALPRRPEDLELPTVGRLIAPGVADSVKKSWRRIDAWLSRNAAKLFKGMHAGATPEKIAEVEATLGMELPEAVRASYLIHDGSEIMRLFPSGEYLSLDGMLDQYGTWKDAEEQYLVWMGDEDGPPGPIQKVHYHLKWLPLTSSGGGDHTVIDLAPAEGGVVGQLVDFSHETGPECVAAPGLAEYLAYLADGLEAGAVTIGEETYLIWNDERDTPRSGYVLPTMGPPPGTAAAGDTTKRYFEFTGDSSHKFWEVGCDGSEMTTRWGKVGAKGQSKTKSFDSPEKAVAETAKLIAQKVKEGYIEKTP